MFSRRDSKKNPADAIIVVQQNCLHSTRMEFHPFNVYHQEVEIFLHRVKNESICYHTYSAMVDDVETLSLVHECRVLEERYRSDLTARILEQQTILTAPVSIEMQRNTSCRRTKHYYQLKCPSISTSIKSPRSSAGKSFGTSHRPWPTRFQES